MPRAGPDDPRGCGDARPEADLPLGPDDRRLSRKVGEIAVDADGVRIVNLSREPSAAGI